jgi:transcriptional regulator with XRE-family HTH domain
MKKFRDFLKEQFKDKEFEKAYYEGLEKARIALEITLYREKKGLTQRELAKKVGTSQSAIARLESPDYRSYSITTLRKVAEALELELVVTFKEKGAEVYEKQPVKVFHVITWPKEREKYDFQVYPFLTIENKEMVA